MSKKDYQGRPDSSRIFQAFEKIVSTQVHASKSLSFLVLVLYLFEILRLLLLLVHTILPNRENAWFYLLILPISIVTIALTASDSTRFMAVKDVMALITISSLTIVGNILRNEVVANRQTSPMLQDKQDQNQTSSNSI